MDRCVNCSVLLTAAITSFRVLEASHDMLDMLRFWIQPVEVSVNDVICAKCFTILQNISTFQCPSCPGSSRQYGYKDVCFLCGKLMKTLLVHELQRNSPEWNLISTAIPPQQVHRLEKICLLCWLHVRHQERQSQHNNFS